MAKTPAGANGYAPNLSMNAEAEEPTLVTRGRETERERVDGRYDPEWVWRWRDLSEELDPS